VQREIFTNKREGVTGVWRKLYTEENHNLCIIGMIRSRRMGWMECWEMREEYKI
jgi:hypothetical protein